MNACGRFSTFDLLKQHFHTVRKESRTQRLRTHQGPGVVRGIFP